MRLNTRTMYAAQEASKMEHLPNAMTTTPICVPLTHRLQTG